MAIEIPINAKRHPQKASARTTDGDTVPFWKRDLILFDRGLNDVRKERLFRELHLLLNSGVDPRTVLDLLTHAQKEPKITRVLVSVRGAVVRGVPFSDALEAEGSFTPYEVHSMRIGEENGRLATVCLQLAEHHADRIKLRRMVRQAFAYPMFVLCITLAVVFFMMNVVVPMFAQVFARSGAELPALTRHVLTVSELLRTGWPIVVAAFMGLAIVYWFVKDRPFWRSWTERATFRVPVLGDLRRKALLARFCRSMAFLLGSASPLDRALEMSERMTGSPALESALVRIRAQVIRGSTLRAAMGQEVFFDSQLIAMIGVAEEVKQLDSMFQRLSERYTDEVQHKTTLLGSVLEPATILLIAVLVGIVLVAMYLPMFKLSTTF
ncbi:MAG: type II secretion system F family protein [Flavobacteriales bacterium]|nr:type II secretion system F family protein [Flavobacteriales bacterium]